MQDWIIQWKIYGHLNDVDPTSNFVNIHWIRHQNSVCKTAELVKPKSDLLKTEVDAQLTIDMT